MLGLMKGRVYYNLLYWYEMYSFLPGFEKRQRSWDQMIGIERKTDFPIHQLPAFSRLCSRAVVLWKLLTLKRTAAKFFAHFEPLHDRFKALDLARATEHELIEVYEALAHQLSDKWALTLDNDLCAMTYYDWLKQLCAKWRLTARANLHNDLLCGGRGVESVAPVHSLANLAAMVRTNWQLSELFQRADDRDVWQAIQTVDGYSALEAALARHLDKYGDRSFEELKLDRLDLREQPERLIRMIRQQLTSTSTVEAMAAREQEIRDNAEKEARALVGNPFKWLIFRFVLSNARRAIANRENMRFARSRLFGVARRLFRRMGQLFAEKGVLQTASDIHYLTVEEIFAFVQGASVTRNLTALVELRRAEYAAFARRTPDERFETIGLPYLNGFNSSAMAIASGNQSRGIGCSSGVAQGRARVVLDPQDDIPTTGQILVARSTDPGWVFLMIGAKGIVAEKGSVLSHTAIIGRELGIPTIVGVKDATQIIPDGVAVAIDGSTGEIRWQSVNSLSARA
jgi:pyruvate,water dikinase